MRTNSLILDTGGWLLALAGVRAYAAALEASHRPIVPGLVLAEMDWHLRSRRADMRRLMREIGRGGYVYEPPSRADLTRADEIDAKFRDRALGLVDATIVALAERLNVPRVLTTDSDFAAARFGSGWKRAFQLVVPLSARP